MTLVDDLLGLNLLLTVSHYLKLNNCVNKRRFFSRT